MATNKGRDSGKLKERLKELQEESGLSKSEVCKRVGITVQRYKNYEEGSTPPIDVLKAFMELYNTDLDYLFGLSDKREPDKPDPQLEELGLDRSFLYDLAKLKEQDDGRKRKNELSNLMLLKLLVHDAASDDGVGCLNTQRNIFVFLQECTSDTKMPVVSKEVMSMVGPSFLEALIDKLGNRLKEEFVELFERTRIKNC